MEVFGIDHDNTLHKDILDVNDCKFVLLLTLVFYIFHRIFFQPLLIHLHTNNTDCKSYDTIDTILILLLFKIRW